MAIEIGGGARRAAKGWGIGVVVLGVALALLDAVVLQGEHVASATVSLSRDDVVLLEIQRPGEEHLVEITTRRRRQGETEGRSVAVRLEDPEGAIVAESSEMLSRKRRYVRFVPELRGAYRLSVRDEGLLGTRPGSARVRVTVGDHRLFGPWISPYLPF